MRSWFGFSRPNTRPPTDPATINPYRPGPGYDAPAYNPLAQQEHDLRRAQFSAADRDGNGALTAEELRGVLPNDNNSTFHPDTVRFLIRLFDSNRNTTIGFDEFCDLLSYLQAWHNVFESFDANHNGTIEGHELHEALPRIGFQLSPELMSLVEQKYGDESDQGGVTFDRFVRACVVIKHITDWFARLPEADRSGRKEIAYDELVHIVLTAP